MPEEDIVVSSKDGSWQALADQSILNIVGYFLLPRTTSNLNRRQGHTLLISYVTDQDGMLMLEKLSNHGIELPAAVQGWHLLEDFLKNYDSW